METTRRDLLVGIFILVAVGVVVGALIVTSGLGRVQRDIYMRTLTAQDLTSDTRVFLQGLAVGRVRQINPLVDSATGGLSFVALLSINERFPDGTPLHLPVGTSALISQPSPIAAPVVELITPRETPGRTALAAGDTIPSQRRTSTMEQLGDVASKLSSEVTAALDDTRRLIARSTHAVDRTAEAVTQANKLMADAAPTIDQALRGLAATLERTERILATVEPRAGPLQDSLTTTLGEAHTLLARLDTLASTAQTLVTENRETMREIARNLQRTAVTLEHFTDQVSRRPTRLLTGVRPPATTDSGPGK